MLVLLYSRYAVNAVVLILRLVVGWTGTNLRVLLLPGHSWVLLTVRLPAAFSLTLAFVEYHGDNNQVFSGN